MKRRTAPLWLLVFSLSILGCKGTDAQRPAADATHNTPASTTTPGATRGSEPGTAAAPNKVQGAAASSGAAVPGNAPNALRVSGDTTSAAQEVRDFEDQLETRDADRGPGDPAPFARKPGFTPYANGRFRFSLDVPKALVALPGPANGDGLQWHLGNQMSMIASGIHWSTEIEGPLCANSPNVTARKETKTSCWATGKRDGFIFWERSVFSRGVLYTLRFQYTESLEATAGPLVTHVNRSWKF